MQRRPIWQGLLAFIHLRRHQKQLRVDYSLKIVWFRQTRSWIKYWKYCQKIPNTIGLVKNTDCNTKITNIEKIIPSATNLQSFSKYLRQTLDFMWNSKIQESFNIYISADFASINKIFILRGRMGTSLEFCEVLRFS